MNQPLAILGIQNTFTFCQSPALVRAATLRFALQFAMPLTPGTNAFKRILNAVSAIMLLAVQLSI